MKLLVLHLSDMHFKDTDNFGADNIKAMVSALRESTKGIEHLLIIISGDLSFSGKESENIQVDIFFNNLKKAIGERYKIQDIHFAIVPGNHDVDYSQGDLGRLGLEKIDTDSSYELILPKELSKQCCFYRLAKSYDCYPEKTVLYKKVIKFDERRILLNLINTAPFSVKDEEDQGFHYISSDDINSLYDQDDSDFIITVMHHPHHWFSSHCKKALESAIYSYSDLIYVGHEHYESSMKVECCNSSVNIFAGGKLCNRGNWSESEFHLGVLDMDTREYITHKYVFNDREKIYEELNVAKACLSQNRYNRLGLTIRGEFEEALLQDKYDISRSNKDYFVFPLLEEYMTEDSIRLPREINSMDTFMRILFDEGKIVITGNRDTGKSILVKAIFTELSKTRITLYLSGKDVTSNFERTIHNAFEDEFSKDRSKYELFKQKTPDEVAIVIDDIDYIEQSKQYDFIEYIEERFGTIVETCQFDVDMDVNIRNRLKQRAKTKNYTFFRIAPFYSNKREQLVEKIVRQIMKNEREAQDKVITLLCDTLTKLKYLYSFNPEFIVQFTKYYCTNIGEAMQNDGSVFSKIFEANLTNLIIPYATKITVEKIFIILDKIAYYIYENSAYPVTLTQIDATIQKYNQEYGSRINTLEFVQLLSRARVFSTLDNGYIFSDRNYLAYFIAREIRRKSLEDGDFSQFNRVMANSHMPINTDILLFVTYITENKNIIKMIMDQAAQSVSDWTEFELENTDISFLVKPVEDIINPVLEGEKQEENQKKIEKEKDEIKSMIVANDKTIFDGESEDLDFLQKIIRSISLMVIVSRTLPSFEHLMKKEDKVACVDLIYQMPLKIFEVWARAVDSITAELVQDIKEFHEWEFRKEKPHHIPVDDNQALYILRWEATSFLLELMHTSIIYATRYNTNDFIDGFAYQKKLSYGIEHLMALGRRESVDSFIKESERLIDIKDSLTKTMIRRVTRNFMVNSKKMKSADIDRLNTKILNQTKLQQRFIIERNRNKKKQ